MLRIAINGYGRIGRAALKAIYESDYQKQIQIVGLNSIRSTKTSAHLTKYDSTHGIFNAKVDYDHKHLIINETKIPTYAIHDPSELPWHDLDVDVVLECSGKFNDGKLASKHLAAGANKVLISAPAPNVDKTIVFGVNQHTLTQNDNIVSNASCTTNCLAPVIQALHQVSPVQNGLMTTIHAVTNDQVLLDTTHKDLRRARSAIGSMIPTKTGAAAAIGLVLPELAGKLDGLAIRVPTMNVSLVDLTATIADNMSIADINDIFIKASKVNSTISINELPLVSTDFNHTKASAIVDITQTKVIQNTVKILAWYDNEWGFANRMLDTALLMGK